MTDGLHINDMDNHSKQTPSDLSIETVLDALSMGLYQRFILLDYANDRLLYISDSFSCICGKSREELYSVPAINFLHSLRPASENERLMEIVEHINALVSGTEGLSPAALTLSVDMNVLRADGTICLTNHQYIPLSFSPDGKTLSKLLIILSLPTSAFAFDKIIVSDRLHGMIYRLTADRQWQCKSAQQYTDRELQILRLAAIGKTRKEVAEILCRSEETIKTTSAGLMKKTGSKNIIEALCNAIHLRLI